MIVNTFYLYQSLLHLLRMCINNRYESISTEIYSNRQIHTRMHTLNQFFSFLYLNNIKLSTKRRRFVAFVRGATHEIDGECVSRLGQSLQNNQDNLWKRLNVFFFFVRSSLKFDTGVRINRGGDIQSKNRFEHLKQSTYTFWTPSDLQITQSHLFLIGLLRNGSNITSNNWHCGCLRWRHRNWVHHDTETFNGMKKKQLRCFISFECQLKHYVLFICLKVYLFRFVSAFTFLCWDWK